MDMTGSATWTGTWTRSMDIQQGHAAWTCTYSMDCRVRRTEEYFTVPSNVLVQRSLKLTKFFFARKREGKCAKF
jgi:hypothetical protein